jgi:hemolysin activation/secretion protein
VRGYALSQQSGTVFGLINGELRIPTAYTHPMLRAQQFTLFADAVLATSLDQPKPILWADGAPKDILLSSGFGARANILGLPLRLDLAWPLQQFRGGAPQVVVSLGRDF